VKTRSRKLGILAVLILLVVSLTACSFGNKSSQGVDTSKKASQNQGSTRGAKIAVDENKTKKLKGENIILNGKVYVQSKKVIATMVVKDGTKDSDAKALAQKYADELKKEHKDMPVSVIAVKNNKNVAKINIK